jgi:hypothetical protein
MSSTPDGEPWLYIWNCIYQFLFEKVLSGLDIDVPVEVIENFNGHDLTPRKFFPCSNITSPCYGSFRLGASNVSLMYVTEDTFAWVAITNNTTNINDHIVEIAVPGGLVKNLYVSQSVMLAAVLNADDILMVETDSLVYAHMKDSGSFAKIRENILNNCSWFKDTHGNSELTDWMKPYASGKYIPDAKQIGCSNYKCCQGCNMGNMVIFDLCNNEYGSHSGLGNHRRFRSGQYLRSSPHSIWFGIESGASGASKLYSMPFTVDDWRINSAIVEGFVYGNGTSFSEQQFVCRGSSSAPVNRAWLSGTFVVISDITDPSICLAMVSLQMSQVGNEWKLFASMIATRMVPSSSRILGTIIRPKSLSFAKTILDLWIAADPSDVGIRVRKVRAVAITLIVYILTYFQETNCINRVGNYECYCSSS